MSGLSTLLRAKKRQALAEKLASIVRTKLETRFKLGRKLDGDDVQELTSPDAE
jgi:hypothetical protein